MTVATAAELMAQGDQDDGGAGDGVAKAALPTGRDGVAKDPSQSANKPDPTPEEKAAAALKVKEAEAAKVVDEKAKADKKIVDEAVAKSKAEQEWPTFTNEYAQSAVNLIKEAGVSIEESRAMFGKAMDTGDISTIDWSKVEAKVGKDKTLLIKAGIEQYHAGEYTDVMKTVNYGHETMGGEEGWDKVKVWAQGREKTDPAFKNQLEAIRQGIRANGGLAQMSIDKLKSLYESDPKNSSLTVRLVQGDTKPVPMGDPLSREDYVTELKKAHNKGGPGLNQAVALLDARRRAGIALKK